MPVNKNLGWTFDTNASAYEKLRPGYPDELYNTILKFIPLNESSNAVEVGIGGGQATERILKTGCNLTAVEYGKNFTKLCKDKFKSYKNFSIITSKFEDVDFPADTYDLIYSASAFHWVPEEIGYAKIFSMLKSGGAFARFAHHPFVCKDDPILMEKIQECYREYYHKFYNTKYEAPREYPEEAARSRAEIAEKYGFKDISYDLFYTTSVYSAGEYIALLGTYSDHIAMEDGVREKFFSAIENAINNRGGIITVTDTIDLQLARK